MENLLYIEGNKKKTPKKITIGGKYYQDDCGSDNYILVRQYYDVVSGSDGKYVVRAADASVVATKSYIDHEKCDMEAMKEYHYPNIPCFPGVSIEIGKEDTMILDIQEDYVMAFGETLNRSDSKGCKTVFSSPIFWIIVIAVVIIVVVVVILLSRKGKKSIMKTKV